MHLTLREGDRAKKKNQIRAFKKHPKHQQRGKMEAALMSRASRPKANQF